MKRQTRILRQTVRQVRRWVLGFCAVCLPGMVALAAEVSVAEVLQAWQARQARVESLRCEFVEERSLYRQSERHLQRRHQVFLKGQKLKHERTGEDWHDQMETVVSPQYVSLFDGETQLLFLGFEEKTNRLHPMGYRSGKTQQLKLSSEANSHTVWPIFHTFRWSQPGFLPTEPSAWRRANQDGTLKGQRYPILEEIQHTAEDQQYRVWVDPQRDYCAIRLEMGPKNIGVTYAQLDIEYAQDVSGIWVPQRWISQVYRQPGNRFVLDYTARYEVTQYELNPTIDESVFQFAFPPGTEVIDESGKTPESYLVLDSGIRPIHKDELMRGARYSDLMSSRPGEALLPPKQRLFHIPWLVLALAAGFVIWWVVRFRGGQSLR